MSDTRFHLGWFLNLTIDAWAEQWSDGARDWTGETVIDVARHLDRVGFDFVLLEDKLMVSDTYGGSFEAELRHAQHSPKLDPAPLIPVLARETQHLGFIVTLSTTFYPPYLLARLVSTLDHLSNGRVGWNIVTSGEDRAAQNFGFDRIPDHDLRYEKADEYVELVRRLWGSWDVDAVVRDESTRTYADHTKVHDIDFEGRFYRSRGPLNVPSSPQRFPVLAQAGASPQGRALAAKYADTIVSPASTPEAMRAFREDVRARARAAGRDPDEIKVLYLVTPILGDDDEHARRRAQERIDDPDFLERSLIAISDVTDIDFAQFDLDSPLPEDLVSHGEQGTLRAMVEGSRGSSLREVILGESGRRKGDLVGSPTTVADRLESLHEQVGGDGFLFQSPGLRLSRKSVMEVTDGLVPELQRRGLVRREYQGPHLRDHLREF